MTRQRRPEHPSVSASVAGTCATPRITGVMLATSPLSTGLRRRGANQPSVRSRVALRGRSRAGRRRRIGLVGRNRRTDGSSVPLEGAERDRSRLDVGRIPCGGDSTGPPTLSPAPRHVGPHRHMCEVEVLVELQRRTRTALPVICGRCTPASDAWTRVARSRCGPGRPWTRSCRRGRPGRRCRCSRRRAPAWYSPGSSSRPPRGPRLSMCAMPRVGVVGPGRPSRRWSRSRARSRGRWCSRRGRRAPSAQGEVAVSCRGRASGRRTSGPGTRSRASGAGSTASRPGLTMFHGPGPGARTGPLPRWVRLAPMFEPGVRMVGFGDDAELLRGGRDDRAGRPASRGAVQRAHDGRVLEGVAVGRSPQVDQPRLVRRRARPSGWSWPAAATSYGDSGCPRRRRFVAIDPPC